MLKNLVDTIVNSNTYVTQEGYVGLAHGMAISNVSTNNFIEWFFDTLKNKKYKNINKNACLTIT